jgi:hypothetical protein
MEAKDWLGVYIHVLIGFTGSNLTSEMFLFIVQILELEMKPIDLLSSLRSCLLGVAHAEDGIPILPAELGEECE